MKYLGLLFTLTFLWACGAGSFNANQPYLELVYAYENNVDIDPAVAEIAMERIAHTGLRKSRYQAVVEEGKLRLRFTEVEPKLMAEIKEMFKYKGDFKVCPTYDYSEIENSLDAVLDSTQKYNTKFGLDTRMIDFLIKNKSSLGLNPGTLGQFQKLQEAPLNRLMSNKKIKEGLPKDLAFYWGNIPNNQMDKMDPDWLEIYNLYLGKVKGDILDRSMIISAQTKMDDDGRYVLQVALNAEGKERFAKMTEENVGKPLLMVLDNEVISAPIVNAAIKGGKFMISNGTKSKEYYEGLGHNLLSKQLAHPLKLLSENVVNP